MFNISDFKPQVIPMQRPYPLIWFKSQIYAQMGAVALIDPIRGIEMWPIVDGYYNPIANSQILKSGYKKVLELYHQLDIHEGEEILWEKFHDLVDIFLYSKDFQLYSFWLKLRRYNVTIRDLPEHIYLYIHLNFLNDPGKENYCFYIDSYQVALKEHNYYYKSEEYEKMKSELLEYKSILPSAQFHLLYDEVDAEEKIAAERIRTDILDFLYSSYEDNDENEDEDTTMCDLILVAETLHKNFNEMELRMSSKSHILDVICKKGHFDPKLREWIWRMLVENNLVDTEKQDETGNSTTPLPLFRHFPDTNENSNEI